MLDHGPRRWRRPGGSGALGSATGWVGVVMAYLRNFSMNKSDAPVLAMLNYLDEPHKADAFVALVIDDSPDGRSPRQRL